MIWFDSLITKQFFNIQYSIIDFLVHSSRIRYCSREGEREDTIDSGFILDLWYNNIWIISLLLWSIFLHCDNIITRERESFRWLRSKTRYELQVGVKRKVLFRAVRNVSGRWGSWIWPLSNSVTIFDIGHMRTARDISSMDSLQEI